MSHYKIGCRWSNEGRPEHSIFDVFESYQTIFIGREKYNDSFSKVKPDDIVAITNGITIAGIAIVKSKQMTLAGMNIPTELRHESERFSHKHEENIREVLFVE